jgi:hypothetical protein
MCLKKGRAISDNHIIGTSKHPMRGHGMLGKETNLNPACISSQKIIGYFRG